MRTLQLVPWLAALCSAAVFAAPLDTRFTYQGRLEDGGSAPTGTYEMQFRLFDAAASGNPVGSPSLNTFSVGTANPVTVTDGVFRVELDFGEAFAGQKRFLAISVKKPADLAYQTLLPRQELTPAPYALNAEFVSDGHIDSASIATDSIQAGNIAAAAVQASEIDTDAVGASEIIAGAVGASEIDSAQVQRRVASACGANEAIRQINADGSIVCETDDAGTNGWSISGNTGTVPGNFLGTKDNQAFEIRVNDRFAWRAIPAFEEPAPGLIYDAPTLIGGASGNSAVSGLDPIIVGGFIGGGGANPNLCNPGGNSSCTNRLLGDFGAVVGGADNLAGASSFVGGGQGNEADNGGAVVGGLGNRANNTTAFVGGGQSNSAAGALSMVLGGNGNVSGGEGSFASGRNAHVRTAAEVGDGDGDQGTFLWTDRSDFDVVESTGPNQFLIRAVGGMGVGTNSPGNQFHAAESLNASGAHPQDHVAQIENTSIGTDGDVLALRVRSSGNPNTSANFITFFDGDYLDGDGSPAADVTLGAIQGNGAGSVVLAAAGADYGEYLPKRDPHAVISPGMLLGVVGNRVGLATGDAQRVMFASTGSIVAGNDPGESQRAAHVLTAFVGQVMAKVRGPVKVGDYILPSGENDGLGVAVDRDALDPARAHLVAGEAWEASGSNEVKPVRVVVGLTRLDPAAQRALAALAEQNAQLRSQLAALATRQQALDARLTALERVDENAQRLALDQRVHEHFVSRGSPE